MSFYHGVSANDDSQIYKHQVIDNSSTTFAEKTAAYPTWQPTSEEEDLVHKQCAKYTLKFTCKLLIWLTLTAAFALTHHYVYRSVDGKTISEVQLSQDWVLRIGTGLAAFYGIAIAQAISVAFEKRAWYDAATSFKTAEDISTAFSMNESFMALLKPRMWFSSTVLVFLVIVKYSTEVPSILAPATLTTTILNYTQTQGCVVPSFSMANTALSSENELVNFVLVKGDPVTARYDTPSTVMARLATRALISNQQVTDWTPPCASSNCTFATTIQAPSFVCSALDGFAEDTIAATTGTDIYYWNATDVKGTDRDTFMVYYGESLTDGTVSCVAYISNWTVTVDQSTSGLTLSASEPLLGEPIGSLGASWDYAIDDPNPPYGMARMIAIKDSVVNLLSGTVYSELIAGPFTGKGRRTVNTSVGLSNNPLLYNASGTPTKEGLLQTLPQLLNNVSLSMLSLGIPENTTTTCDSSFSRVAYTYDSKVLLSSYFSIFAVTVFIILYATRLFKIDIGREISFNDFLVTTRNSHLDQLVDNDGKVAEDVKLRYGFLARGGKMVFGTKKDLL